MIVRSCWVVKLQELTRSFSVSASLSVSLAFVFSLAQAVSPSSIRVSNCDSACLPVSLWLFPNPLYADVSVPSLPPVSHLSLSLTHSFTLKLRLCNIRVSNAVSAFLLVHTHPIHTHPSASTTCISFSCTCSRESPTCVRKRK